MTGTASLAWFAHHEFRLAWRDWLSMLTAGKRRRARVVALAFLAFAVFMHFVAYSVVAQFAEIEVDADRGTLVVITGCALLAWSLMMSQAMESVTRAFGQRRVHADTGRRAGGAQDHPHRLNADRGGRLQAAMQRPRRKVTVVHKANVLRLSDGLFLECTRAVAARYPQVECEEQIMDAMAALLVRDASRFDVIVTTNAFGDILSDEASEIAGSLGLAASINHGDEHGVAQAQHGSAPDIEGQDKANPASLIGSVAMLLAWLGERRKSDDLIKAAKLIERALEKTIENPQWRTADLGGPLGTRAFGERVAEVVAELAK